MGDGPPPVSPPPVKRQRLDGAAANAAAAALAAAAAEVAATAAANPQLVPNPAMGLQPQLADEPTAGPSTVAAAAAAGGGATALDALSHQQRCGLAQTDAGRHVLASTLDPHTQCMVECGTATGLFSLSSERVHCLCNACAEQRDGRAAEFLPSEFERHAGMAACKKWRFSIKVRLFLCSTIYACPGRFTAAALLIVSDRMPSPLFPAGNPHPLLNAPPVKLHLDDTPRSATAGPG